jgi:hypothetical protein
VLWAERDLLAVAIDDDEPYLLLPSNLALLTVVLVQ